jgi:hypothetical protein
VVTTFCFWDCQLKNSTPEMLSWSPRRRRGQSHWSRSASRYHRGDTHTHGSVYRWCNRGGASPPRDDLMRIMRGPWRRRWSPISGLYQDEGSSSKIGTPGRPTTCNDLV